MLAGRGLALPSEARAVVADASTDVLVPAGTVWEIALKKAAGRLEAPDDLLDALAANDFDTLAITAGQRSGPQPSLGMTPILSTTC